jgi:hypothetical protein
MIVCIEDSGDEGSTPLYKILHSFTDPLPRQCFHRAIINHGTHNMNRLLWLVCGIVLMMNPYALLAQHRGGHGGGMARPPGGESRTDDLKDFKRAIALQANPDQVLQFRRLTESTHVARTTAQGLVKLADNAKTDLFRSSDHLASALDKAQTDNQHFLQSFSDSQKSGLKEITKKLGKANSDVTKRSKALTRDLERPRIAVQQISGAAEKLDKALSDFQTRQLAIGNEMGIQSEGSSQ